MSESTVSALYRRIVEEAQDAIVVADREGTILLWNGGAETIFGHPASEAVGQSLDLIIPERLRERHWEGWRRVIATGETRYGRELLAVPGQRADGARISLEFSIALLRDAGGAIESVVAILRDSTARWEKDRETAKRIADLEARVRAV